MQQSQFLLVICSTWQRMEAFTKCIINCKSSFKSSTLAEKLSEVTLDEVQTAAKHILSGEKTSNDTLKKYFQASEVKNHLLVIPMKPHHVLDKNCFHYGITSGHQQYFLLWLHVMNVAFVLDYMLLVKVMNFLVQITLNLKINVCLIWRLGRNRGVDFHVHAH